MAHYDFCIWEDIELRASDPYDMILTLNYRIMSPTRIIADFRVSTRFYIFEHKNIFALSKRILGLIKKRLKKRVKNVKFDITYSIIHVSRTISKNITSNLHLQTLILNRYKNRHIFFVTTNLSWMGLHSFMTWSKYICL